MIYEVRPAICRIVPFFITDFDYEQNVIEVDLSPECECLGVNTYENLPLEEMGKTAQSIVEDMILRMASKHGLPPTDRKVLSLARIWIMGQLSDLKE